jgi:NTE family protein
VTTAFVLSGGGSLGAVQVGMLQALLDHRLTPDVVIGASAGALNAAYVAGHGVDHRTLEQLAGIWRRLRRQDVFPFSPHRQLLALAGARPSLCSADGLRRLIDTNLHLRRLEDASIPVHVVATDVLSGTEVVLSHGDVGPAVLASTAIPAVLPPVTIDGQLLFDGGIADNTPISHAIALGVERVVVLPAGVACALAAPPRTALAVAVHAISLLVAQRLVHDVAGYQDQVELIVVPPLCPLAVASSDFRSAGALIERARAATTGWLDAGNHRLPHPERFLGMHRHDRLTEASQERVHPQSQIVDCVHYLLVCRCGRRRPGAPLQPSVDGGPRAPRSRPAGNGALADRSAGDLRARPR